MYSVCQTQLSSRSGRQAWFAVAVLATVGTTATSLQSEAAIAVPLTVTLKVTRAAAVPGADIVLGDPTPQLTVCSRTLALSPSDCGRIVTAGDTGTSRSS